MDQIGARDMSTTFVKGIRVLKAFDDADTHMTLSDLSRKTGLDRATVRRLVLSLVALGYARKDGRQYSLTPQVLALAGSFLQGNAFGREVQPLLNRASEALGGPVLLAIRDGDAAVIVGQAVARAQPVTIGLTVGSRLPLTHSAIGRMMLAYGAEDWAAAVLEGAELVPLTERSLVDRGAVRRAVAACRTQGFAVVVDELEMGVTGIAAPVGAVGAVKAVVGTSFEHGDVVGREGVVRGILQSLAVELAEVRLFSQG
ncbi:IclR family transcriptional regulator domain-containing protein [Shimia abyssi]|uniref:IclR family transcriptional regulator n=1 Tax=Shimia abyssi TaxID=1662395 RepID=A0A2P8F5V9_9RHOB|nr:IclR family transcriptional regulator C-terminal domain-containing protein [Shimia abyssi]PSL17096.1 IclR family transcriptional regulator [Shimia abyssi]